jgi:hypothetical protein
VTSHRERACLPRDTPRIDGSSRTLVAGLGHG